MNYPKTSLNKKINNNTIIKLLIWKNLNRIVQTINIVIEANQQFLEKILKILH